MQHTDTHAPTPTVEVRDAPPLRFRGCDSASPEAPGECDCNCPAHWDGGTLYVFNSAGHPWRLGGRHLTRLGAEDYVRCDYDNAANGGRWLEATWKGSSALYGWYHIEPWGLCTDRPGLTAPQVGAVRSADNGATWHDLGIVMAERASKLRWDTHNHYFAGGVGDFCVARARDEDAFYFFVSTYGDLEEQGVSVARMSAGDLDEPVGRVRRWHGGRWDEPGLEGRSTPIFAAAVDWHREDADAFWGPSVHYNTHLGCWVMLLNRAKDKDWTQEGVYVAFADRLDDPRRWSEPARIMDPVRPDGWYPQVIGLEGSGTDKEAGRVARLFVRGESRWEVVLHRER